MNDDGSVAFRRAPVRSQRRVVRAKVRRTRNVYVPESGWRGIGWLLPVAAAVAILALATVRFQNVGGTGIPGTVEGLPVMSVSEVLSERASGALTGGSVAVGGFWSSGVERLACAPAPDAGELEKIGRAHV